MTDELNIRRGTLDDLQSVVDLWNEAKAWLASIGSDQWQYPVRVEGIRKHIDEGNLWVVPDDDGLVAMITLTDYADDSLWHLVSDPEDALYVHRLVVSRKASGRDLGERLLHWADSRAVSLGRGRLRLDAWTSNQDLHAYYLRLGFRYLGVSDPTQRSAALFEKAIVTAAVMPKR